MGRFIDYLREIRMELKHVSWPTQRQALVFTVLVIALSILVSLFLGLFDYIFTTGLDLFIN